MVVVSSEVVVIIFLVFVVNRTVVVGVIVLTWVVDSTPAHVMMRVLDVNSTTAVDIVRLFVFNRAAVHTMVLVLV